MIHLMSNEEKIIKRLRNSAMSYLARYEVSIHQFESTMKRKLSNFQHDLSETESIKFIDSTTCCELSNNSHSPN